MASRRSPAASYSRKLPAYTRLIVTVATIIICVSGCVAMAGRHSLLCFHCLLMQSNRFFLKTCLPVKKTTPIETKVDARCFYWRFYVKVIRGLPSYEVHDKLVEL